MKKEEAAWLDFFSNCNLRKVNNEIGNFHLDLVFGHQLMYILKNQKLKPRKCTSKSILPKSVCFTVHFQKSNKMASKPWNSLIVPSIGRSSISSKHNKENRPLNDRDWQKDVVRELVGFCINNGYQNAALSTKDFHPINTTTFR